jgi:hypothetical protein
MLDLFRRLIALALLLGGLHGPAPAKVPAAAVYVPGPQNKFAPKPSCATLVDPKEKKAPWTRWLAACATTHGLVVKGPFPTRKAATSAADAVYDAELAAQGGELRP